MRGSERPSERVPAPARLHRTAAPESSRDERRDGSKPAWLEPWLEAEEDEVYDLPCTD